MKLTPPSTVRRPPPDEVRLVDAWRVPDAQTFFRSTWPLYVHELSGFDSDFYTLDASGRWQPDICEDWIRPKTPVSNLRASERQLDESQPFQRAHVIATGDHPVGFACIGLRPFRYMPEDVDHRFAELFLTHVARASGVATRTVELVFQRYPGTWQLEAIHDNLRAIAFWRKALPACRVRNLDESRHGREVVFRFTTGKLPRE